LPLPVFSLIPARRKPLPGPHDEKAGRTAAHLTWLRLMLNGLANVKILLSFCPIFGSNRLGFRRAAGCCFAPLGETISSGKNRVIELQFKVVVHDAEEGGYWAEVPAVPGCASQGDTMEELMDNIREAIRGCLSVDLDAAAKTPGVRILEIAV
jgi:predicted RNase H-like HicB family nuclease